MNSKHKPDDLWHSELAKGADFDGIFEMPVIPKPKSLVIPDRAIPFSQIKQTDKNSETLVFNVFDKEFECVLLDPSAYVDEFSKFPLMFSLDCSVYRDMPLATQIGNTYKNRLVGSFYQRQNGNVVPFIRWGDERSYTTCLFDEAFAFSGIKYRSPIAVGTYGCIGGKENKRHFKSGLEAALEIINPPVIFVYGPMPDAIFGDFEHRTHFIHYEDWITGRHHG